MSTIKNLILAIGKNDKFKINSKLSFYILLATFFLFYSLQQKVLLNKPLYLFKSSFFSWLQIK